LCRKNNKLKLFMIEQFKDIEHCLFVYDIRYYYCKSRRGSKNFCRRSSEGLGAL